MATAYFIGPNRDRICVGELHGPAIGDTVTIGDWTIPQADCYPSFALAKQALLDEVRSHLEDARRAYEAALDLLRDVKAQTHPPLTKEEVREQIARGMITPIV